jgi:phosphoglycolate phosphatase
MQSNQKRAVIFDLDGTLIDSDPDILAALNRVLATRGLAALTRAEVKKMIGDGAKTLVERAFAAQGGVGGPAELEAFLDDYNVNAVVETVPYPGIPEALEALQAAGHPLGVCTNKPEGAARHILSVLGLERFFTTITGGDTTPFKKPDPRHLEAALLALSAGQNAVMIGDHINDIDAAAGAGIPSIFVRWGYGSAQGSHSVAKASELPGLIAAMG